jgi:aspartate/methionine/tyrosine aminotransferase
VGWAIGQPHVFGPCARMRDYTTLHLSPLVEFIAERAVRHGDVLLAPRLEAVRANRRALDAWLEAHAEHVHGRAPGGGVCAFPKVMGMRDTTALCEAAAREGVLLVPGACFGYANHVRLGFGAAPAAFREGLARLSRVLANAGPAFDSPTDGSGVMRRRR